MVCVIYAPKTCLEMLYERTAYAELNRAAFFMEREALQSGHWVGDVVQT